MASSFLRKLARKRSRSHQVNVRHPDHGLIYQASIWIAGTTGTTITVEDLFYNMPTRKQAFKNLNDEYQRIVEVMTRYSVHFGDKKVSFTCKKYGQSIPDLHTPANSTTVDNIKVAFGASLARELIPVTFRSAGDDLQSFSVEVTGRVTNANYSNKKAVYILFINNRLVECPAIRRTVESVYGELLPKHTFPFVYLSFSMPARHIDVNVHPTKKEVHFLFEDELLELLHSELTKVLVSANESRSFSVQTTLLSNSNRRDVDHVIEDERNKRNESYSEPFPRQESSAFLGTSFNNPETEEWSSSSAARDQPSPLDHLALSSSSVNERGGVKRKVSVTSSAKPAPNKMVRTDPSLVKIKQFFTPSPVVPPVKASEDAVGSSFLKEDEDDVERKATAVLGPNPRDVPFSFLCMKGRKTTVGSEQKCSCCEGNDLEREPSPSPSPRKIEVDSVPLSLLNRAPLQAFGETTCEYSSIQSLLSDIRQQRNATIEGILRNHSYVGAVSASSSLIQHGTKLLLVDHRSLLRSLFYQLSIRRFATDSPILTLARPVDIELFILAAFASHGAGGGGGHVWRRDSRTFPVKEGPERVAASVSQLLFAKAEMLKEYFSIQIAEDENGRVQLHALPALLEVMHPCPLHTCSNSPLPPQGYEPLAKELPEFLLRLAADTVWNVEKDCFYSIAALLADYYSLLDDPFQSGKTRIEEQKALEALSLRLEGQLYPALRAHLIPSERDTPLRTTFREIAALEQLYKVFERC